MLGTCAAPSSAQPAAHSTGPPTGTKSKGDTPQPSPPAPCRVLQAPQKVDCTPRMPHAHCPLSADRQQTKTAIAPAPCRVLAALPVQVLHIQLAHLVSSGCNRHDPAGAALGSRGKGGSQAVCAGDVRGSRADGGSQVQGGRSGLTADGCKLSLWLDEQERGGAWQECKQAGRRAVAWQAQRRQAKQHCSRIAYSSLTVAFILGSSSWVR